MPESSKFHSTKPRGWLLTFAVAGFAFLAATLAPVQTTVAQGQPAVDIQASTDGISVDFFATTPRNVLTFSVRVVGPGNFVFEQRIEGATLQWIPPDNLADGVYNWEAWVVTADVGAQMRDPSPALKGRAVDHWFHEAVKQTHIASGTFRVENGLLGSISNSPNEADSAPMTRRIAGAILDFLVPSANAEETINDSLTINRRLVALNRDPGNGSDSRILLSDGSTLTPWWRIRNNTSAGRLDISRSDSSSAQLSIVNASGNVGMGTTAPARRLHVMPDAGSFQMRLEGAGGNFVDFQQGFVGLFLTHTGTEEGASIEFWNNADPNSLVVIGSSVGMGTDAPAAALHIQRANNTAQIRVEDTAAVVGVPPAMFTLQQNGFPRFNMRDNSQTNVNWDFRLSGNAGTTERFTITKVGTGGAEMELFHNGNMTIAGTLTQSSSRAVKERITDLAPEAVLARLEQLGVHEWSYQRSPNERHLGPMAEDFHAAFGLGGSDKHIAPGDLAGVALAAAKGLAGRAATLEAENKAKGERIAELESKSAALESKSAVLGSENAELRERLDRETAELRDRLEQLETMLLSSM